MKITIIDDLHPEDNAMLQALQSRSPASVEERLEKVRESGSGNFMDKFYVGYGHRSIGDCGTTTVYIEGVTMLCAKAIQDWPLYSGQEASTRYMDFSEAKFHDPLSSTASEMVLDIWRTMYLTVQEKIGDHLREQYPRQEGEDEATYERAIKARGFDIARAFLPAGAHTNLSWHTNLRQAADHLTWMRHHPDRHIGYTAAGIIDDLREKYPHSFELGLRPDKPENRAAWDWQRGTMQDHYFLPPESIPFRRDEAFPVYVNCDGLELDRLTLSDWELLANRPRRADVPWYFAEFGQIRSTFPLDFGSYRDLQRHRNGTIRMPLLTTRMGFHPWYLESLPLSLRKEVEDCIREQKLVIDNLDCDDATRQNYIAMGFMVPCRVTQTLPAFIYRMELRSSKSVHPTLRTVVLEELLQFQQKRNVQNPINIYADLDPDSWSVRRGKQTITEKP